MFVSVKVSECLTIHLKLSSDFETLLLTVINRDMIFNLISSKAEILYMVTL